MVTKNCLSSLIFKIKRLRFIVFALLLVTCTNENPTTANPLIPDNLGPFSIEGTNVLVNGEPKYYKGVNALQTFGLGNADLMDSWNVEIIREFIGNLREQPINGDAILASDGVWYHSLQKIVDRNREHNKITIFCPFGWVNTNGVQTLFTGLNPASQSFYNDYKLKMRLIAEHFKNQPDVWIEVWNEPYHWNNENGYNHELWLRDMKDMVDNLRMVEAFQNIIVVPGNEQGQSEDAILSKGNDLLRDRYNLIFDLHAYEKWLLNTTEEDLVLKIQNIRTHDFAFIIGEVGVQNVDDVMPVQHFLNAATTTKTTTLAWLWNQNSQDNNALLTDDGQPNNTNNNNFWGLKYKAFLSN